MMAVEKVDEPCGSFDGVIICNQQAQSALQLDDHSRPHWRGEFHFHKSHVSDAPDFSRLAGYASC
jgi:hypothetical protein